MSKNRLDKRIHLSNAILSQIGEIDAMNGQWKGGLDLNPRILGQLRRSVIVTSTGASTRIEGARMSDAEVERFLRGMRQREPKDRSEEEVAGYADALGRIFDNYKSLKLTEGQILQLHQIMLAFSTKDAVHRGAYKSKDNTVAIVERGKVREVLFEPTPPHLVKKEMSEMLQWYHERREEADVHALIVIANVIFEFLAIHPFEDGNGRLSRALTNLLLLQHGYAYVPYVSLEEIIEDAQTEYYIALRATQKNHKTEEEDITPWLLFLLKCLHVQAQRALALLEKEDATKLLSPAQHTVHDLFGPGVELSVSQVVDRVAVPRPTAKQALARLVEHGLLERLGRGPATRYRRKVR